MFLFGLDDPSAPDPVQSGQPVLTPPSPLDLITRLMTVGSVYSCRSYWPLDFWLIDQIWTVWSVDQIITAVQSVYLCFQCFLTRKKSRKTPKLIQTGILRFYFIYLHIIIYHIICKVLLIIILLYSIYIIYIIYLHSIIYLYILYICYLNIL